MAISRLVEPAGMPVGRRTALRALGAAGLGLLVGGGAHGYLYERHRLGVTRASLPVSGLPESLHGLRVALLTDLHLSETLPREDLDRAVRLAMAELPDIVILGGDYVSFQDRRFMDDCADVLSPLTAPNGVFAVLGNHDDDVEMPRALMRHGVEVLKDARTRVTIRGEGLELIGLRFWTRQTSEITRLMRGADGTTVLLAHDPRRFAQAAALNIPLVLSGHTHGGQIVLPGLGAIAARKFPVSEGSIRRENTTMFVSRGIGTVYVPCRINCPPEVALLTLTRQIGRA
jgi:predicted MPP superfamily phosphohydrolase